MHNSSRKRTKGLNDKFVYYFITLRMKTKIYAYLLILYHIYFQKVLLNRFSNKLIERVNAAYTAMLSTGSYAFFISLSKETGVVPDS